MILESDPYRRLAYTWHTFSPEWATAHGIDEKAVAAWRAEPRSKVAFDIEEAGQGVVKLTVVHDGFEPGSGVLEGVSHGWPAVVSSLKSLRRPGRPCPRRRAAGLAPMLTSAFGGHPEPVDVEGESAAPLGAVEAELRQVVLDGAMATAGVLGHEVGHGGACRLVERLPGEPVDALDHGYVVGHELVEVDVDRLVGR